MKLFSLDGVVLAARDVSKLEEAAAEIRAAGFRADIESSGGEIR